MYEFAVFSNLSHPSHGKSNKSSAVKLGMLLILAMYLYIYIIYRCYVKKKHNFNPKTILNKL